MTETEKDSTTMTEARWIQAPLFVMLLLHFTVASRQSPRVVVQAGGDVVLPCENAITAGDKCGSISWSFASFGRATAEMLFEFGMIGEKADRVSVTEKCSLVIMNVTVEDVGQYNCRVSKSGQEEAQVSAVYLSVVTMTEHQDGDTVTLKCSVSTYGWCRHRVKWLYMDEDDKDTETSQTKCVVTVTLPGSRVRQRLQQPETFRCEVANVYNMEVQRFPLSRQCWCEETGDDPTTATTVSATTVTSTWTTGNTGTTGEMSKCEDWWRLIIVSAGLSALIISVVTVNIWTRTKGNKTPTDGNTEHNDEDEDEGAVVYENTGEPSVSIRLH